MKTDVTVVHLNDENEDWLKDKSQEEGPEPVKPGTSPDVAALATRFLASLKKRG